MGAGQAAAIMGQTVYMKCNNIVHCHRNIAAQGQDAKENYQEKLWFCSHVEGNAIEGDFSLVPRLSLGYKRRAAACPVPQAVAARPCRKNAEGA